VLLEIIIPLETFGFLRNLFDCVSRRAVSFRSLEFRIIAMLELFTAFCGVMSACIFIAHAYDGYRSR
jgi:hypothetical protein